MSILTKEKATLLDPEAKLRWKASYLVEVLDETTVLLVDDSDCSVLVGRVYSLLAPLLDGRHSVSDLLEALEPHAGFLEVSYALKVAGDQGHLLSDGEADPDIATFWHSLNVDTKSAEQRLAEARIAVSALGDLETRSMETSLRLAGLEPAAEGTFRLVLTDDYLRPELESVNLRALADKQPWMLVRPVGNEVWVGPVFRPGETGCWECLAQRLRSHRQIEAFLERTKELTEPVRLPRSRFPSLVQTALDLAATEVAKAIALDSGNLLDGAVLTLDSLTLTSAKHQLIRRPQCPVCGDADLRRTMPGPVVLRSSPRRSGSDSGYRSASPEETHSKLIKHLSPITGVIRVLERTSKDTSRGLMHSFSAGHNFALLSYDLRFVMLNMRGRSGGKGTSEIQARVSAMCEAIERYSGLHQGDEFARKASYSDLNEQAIQPNEIMLFSDSQYDNRVQWNKDHESGFHHVPERFDPERPIDWTLAWSLTKQEARYVPSAYCYYGHPDIRNWFFCTSDSNGNAAGNTLEEAILQGCLELVERDAVALWWYNRLERPAVDLDSLDESYICDLRDYYHSIQRDFWVLNITSDLGIPVFAAVSRRIDHPVEDIVVGFGAHFDPHVAILRAITEINQFMPSVERRDSDGNTMYWFPDPEAIKWWKTQTLQGNPYLAPAVGLAKQPIRLGAVRPENDLKLEVEKCVKLLDNHGLETLVLEQTAPDVGLNVVKVMIPGLRHFWKRFGPGRLFDVPVKEGWLEEARKESELNPNGIFF